MENVFIMKHPLITHKISRPRTFRNVAEMLHLSVYHIYRK